LTEGRSGSTGCKSQGKGKIKLEERGGIGDENEKKYFLSEWNVMEQR
jgi:hypothetical protein